MKIAVFGAGAIGGLVAGYLKQAGEDVYLVGRSASREAISRNGLFIRGVRGEYKIDIEVKEKLFDSADLLILATKTQDIEEALKNNLEFFINSNILSVQNGVQADKIISRYVAAEKIISSIVMFGATYNSAYEITHNFEGKWVLGRMFCANDAVVEKVAAVLGKAFAVVITENILGMKYLKIFLNANNCLSAILGKSMQETFSDLDICRISIAIFKEGLRILEEAKINLESLPDFPLERLQQLVSLPQNQAAKIFCGIMRGLSKEPLYGSILQSIQRERASEIDYINGEFVNIAHRLGQRAPLNEKLVEMVHEVEAKKHFFSQAELIRATQEYL